MHSVIGQKFNHLTVFREAPKAKRRMVECLCDCGHTVTVRLDHLKGGRTKSCGCLHGGRYGSYIRPTQPKKDGRSNTPEYRTWQNIKGRCLNPRNRDYKNYGSRGIIVCKRWLESFDAFLADMGPRPDRRHSIDRINNDGNYEPTNCRWATKQEQRVNQRPHHVSAERLAELLRKEKLLEKLLHLRA